MRARGWTLIFRPAFALTFSLSLSLGVFVTKVVENHIERPFLVFEPREPDPLSQAVDSLFVALQAPEPSRVDTLLQFIELPPVRRTFWDTVTVIDRGTVLDTVTVVRYLDVMDTTEVMLGHRTPWRQDSRRP